MSRDNEGMRRPDRVAEIFDAEWEARARKTLELSGFDPDLAIEVARDALRVVTGDIDEDQFHARHHKAYVEEFEVDDRPRLFSSEEPAEAEPAPEPAMETEPEASPDAPEGEKNGRGVLSRRAAIGLAGGGAAALFLGDLLQAPMGAAGNDNPAGAGRGGDTPAGADTQDAASGSDRKVRMGMVIDLSKCEKLLMCAGGCKSGNGLPDGVHWIHTQAFQEPDRGDDIHYLVKNCQHCYNAPCVMVCPTTARHRREDGLVLTDYDLCFGCRYCQVSCPYGVNFFGWADPELHGGGYTGKRTDYRGKNVAGAPPTGMMGKCTFAVQRQESEATRGSTYCSSSCPNGVIHFGDINDPESEPLQYLRQRLNETQGQLSTFRLLEDLGTEPSIIFIGQEPSKNAEPVDGPRVHEEWGFVEERRSLLEGPEPWFKRIFGRD